MKVKCTSERLSPEEERRYTELYLKPEHRPNWGFDVELGQEYAVLAMEIARGEAWVLLPASIPRARWVPLVLFQITDPTLPAGWGVCRKRDGIGIWWPALNDPYFLDDVDEGVDAATREYQRLVALC
jgi:hypothetical protein